MAAVQLEPLTAGGGRQRWLDAGARKSFGAIRGAALRVPGRGDGELHVAEGPVDALAAGGASNLVNLAALITAAGRLLGSLHRSGAAARIEYAPEGSDPAGELAADWRERAAIIEYGAGVSRREAEAEAWRDAKRPAGAKPAGRQERTEPAPAERRGRMTDTDMHPHGGSLTETSRSQSHDRPQQKKEPVT